MGRRTLDCIQDKILTETVKMGAQNGIENISTSEIAKLCDISEPTIYVHFKTKRNLIIQAGRRMDKVIKDAVMSTHFDIRDSVFLRQEIKNTWLKIFNYLLENPNDTKYYIRYRQSAFFQLSIDFSEGSSYARAVKYMLSRNSKFAEYSEIGYNAVMIFAINSTLTFARAIIDGMLKKDDKILDLMFKLIFGMFI